MPPFNPIQTNFTAGEISPRMLGRVDVARYGNATRKLQNFIIQQQGGAYRRSGTRFVKAVKDSSKITRLIPFEFSTLQAYSLEFGDQYIRFYKDQGNIVGATLPVTDATNASPIVITAAAHGIVNGHEVTISGVLGNTAANGVWVVAAVTANTFELVGSTGNAAYISGGTALETIELSTPYLEADLMNIQFTQSADTLYIVHPNYAPRKLTRSSHTNWTLTTISFIDGPYQSEKENLTITPSGTSGSVTLTASAALFAATDVGRLVRLRHAAAWSYLVITAFTNTTTVTATVQSASTTASASTAYRMGAFYDAATKNYPQCVVFHDQRLIFSNTPAEPQTFWMSSSGDYENFEPTDAMTSTVLDSSAITATIVSNKVNATRWMVSGTVLSLGTVGSEWQVKAGTINEAITPTNVNVTEQTSWGSRLIRPVKIGSAALFVQRSGRKIREYQYTFQSDAFQARDLTLLAEHILREGDFVQDMCYQQEPDSVVWIALSNGVLAGMTYVAEQEIVGLHRHILGGSLVGFAQAAVKSLCCIPTSDGTTDELWVIVKRTINGMTKQYVEFMEAPFLPASPTDKNDMFFVDSGLTYSGAPATIISGLSHLEGQSVAILADGSVHPDRVVAAGSVTLQAPASVIQVGLKYISRIQTLPLEGGGTAGTTQGKKKRVHRVAVRLLNSLSMKYGPDENNLVELSFRGTNDPMDSSPPLFTGDKDVDLNTSFESEGDYVIEQSDPYPLNILSLMPKSRNTEQ